MSVFFFIGQIFHHLRVEVVLVSVDPSANWGRHRFAFVFCLMNDGPATANVFASALESAVRRHNHWHSSCVSLQSKQRERERERERERGHLVTKARQSSGRVFHKYTGFIRLAVNKKRLLTPRSLWSAFFLRFRPISCRVFETSAGSRRVYSD